MSVEQKRQVESRADQQLAAWMRRALLAFTIFVQPHQVEMQPEPPQTAQTPKTGERNSVEGLQLRPLPEATLLGNPKLREEITDITVPEFNEAVEAVHQFPLQQYLESLAAASSIPVAELAEQINHITNVMLYTDGSLASIEQHTKLEPGVATFFKALRESLARTAMLKNGDKVVHLNLSSTTDQLDKATPTEQVWYGLGHELVHVVHERGIALSVPFSEALTYSLRDRLWHAEGKHSLSPAEHLYGYTVVGDVLFAVGHEYGVAVEQKFLRGDFNQLEQELSLASGSLDAVSTMDRRLWQAQPLVDNGQSCIPVIKQLMTLPNNRLERILKEVNQGADYHLVYASDGVSLAVLIRDQQGTVRNGLLARRDQEKRMFIRSFDPATPAQAVDANGVHYSYGAAPDDWSHLSDEQLQRAAVQARLN